VSPATPGSATPRLDGLEVVHVAATANGAHWMYEMLRALRRRGYHATALIAGTDGTLAPKLEAAGIPYHVADTDPFSGASLRSLADKTLACARYFRAHRFDIVHTHLFPSMLLGRTAAWIADVPVRFSMNPGPLILEAPAMRTLERLTAWMDSKVIASCERTRRLYVEQGLPYEKTELIYYGADAHQFDPARADGSKLRRELGLDERHRIVGIVAYFYPPSGPGPWIPPHLANRAVKGHDVLLAAARLVLRRQPDAKFVLVGDGWGEAGRRYEQGLRESVARSDLRDAVLFTGFRADIPDVLAAFDVSVQCSLSENLGGAIESLLMARPTVATAVGGMVDAVRDGETGLLVPPDDPRRLADAIERLIADRVLAHRLGARGRELMCRQFSLERTVDRLDALYQATCREALRRAPDGSARPADGYYRPSRTALRLASVARRLGPRVLRYALLGRL
jgi:glycosyltransferase involved in cell wall biosynthesis